MTIETGTGDRVKIRTAGLLWVVWSILAVVWFWLGAGHLGKGQYWSVLRDLALGCVFAAMVWRSRTSGVDLTPECAIVRGLRLRRIPWPQVQAVVRRTDSGGPSRVQLILVKGKSVPLHARWVSTAQFERDFQCIDQWWLAHRGNSWRPIRPEASQPPTQE
jgi:hypothetical protein